MYKNKKISSLHNLHRQITHVNWSTLLFVHINNSCACVRVVWYSLFHEQHNEYANFNLNRDSYSCINVQSNKWITTWMPSEKWMMRQSGGGGGGEKLEKYEINTNKNDCIEK